MAKPADSASASLHSPPSVKGQARAALILNMAEAILIEEGYSAFSTRKIAERLGMRLSNVQYYFASRGDIMQALLARSLRQSTAAMKASVHDGGMEDAVAFVLKDQLSMQSCRLFWELWALSARDKDAAKAMKDFYRTYQRLVGALVGTLRPDLNKSEVASRATVITGLLEGISLFRGHGRSGKVGRATLDVEVFRAVRLIATA